MFLSLSRRVTMNLWDSVHRGLEKASQEAARIAKTQRLRGNIDNLSRQIHTQHDNLLRKVMELFTSGQLTQSELIPLCQELANLQQQLQAFQSELKHLQSLGAPPVQPAQPAAPMAPPPYAPPNSPLPGNEPIAPTVYAPPPPEHQLYIDTTVPVSTPPPPPPSGEPVTVSAIETLLLSTNVQSLPAVEKQVCSTCRLEVAPGNAFCHNCGSPVHTSNVAHLPTVRGGTLEPVYPEGQETIRSSSSGTLPTPQPKDGGE
jgi:hypothetical protein